MAIASYVDDPMSPCNCAAECKAGCPRWEPSREKIMSELNDGFVEKDMTLHPGPQTAKDLELPVPPSAFNEQVGGAHYKNMKIQPINFILANDLNFTQGVVIKYVCRYKAKNGIEDLKKAIHFLEMLIEHEEKQ